MAMLSVLLILNAYRQVAAPTQRSIFPGGKALRTLGTVGAGLATYILLLEVLGFLVGTGLLTAFLLGFVEREKWSTTLLVAVLNSVGLYVVFQRLLGVNLPMNRFGF